MAIINGEKVMDLVTALATYFLIWWITLFLVLPRGGVEPLDKPEAGHEVGAPASPKIKQKFIWNSILAGIVWGIAYSLILLFDFNLRDALP